MSEIADLLRRSDLRDDGASRMAAVRVFKDRSELSELLDELCYGDERTRIRAADAIRRVAVRRSEWMAVYIDRFYECGSPHEDAPTRYVQTQLTPVLLSHMKESQIEVAVSMLERNLRHSDHEVVTKSIGVAATTVRRSVTRLDRFEPALRALLKDQRDGVADLAGYYLSKLNG